MKKIIPLVFLSALSLVVILSAAFFWSKPQSAEAGPLINYMPQITTASSVWIGKDIDTTLVATNTTRTYLEISNISGATTTAQALYCNVNGKAAIVYSGLFLNSSSTTIFDQDRLYTGALHCKFPVSSSTVTILER